MIYKYTTFERARYILRNNCLPLGHLSNYNDPYEFSISFFDEELASFKNILTDKQKKEMLIRAVEKIADEENWSRDMRSASASAIGGYGASALASFNILAAILLMGGAYLYSYLEKNGKEKSITPNQLDEYMKKLLPLLSHTYTACMSNELNNFLLWSHYADSHKGVVIGLNTDKQPFSDNPPQNVIYKNSRFSLDVDRILKCDVENDIREIILRKSKIWRYEQECRFIFDSDINHDKIIWYDNYDNPIILLDENSIGGVYFGCRVNNERIQQIKSILSSQNRKDPVEIKKCKLSLSDYGLDFIDV